MEKLQEKASRGAPSGGDRQHRGFSESSRRLRPAGQGPSLSTDKAPAPRASWGLVQTTHTEPELNWESHFTSGPPMPQAYEIHPRLTVQDEWKKGPHSQRGAWAPRPPKVLASLYAGRCRGKPSTPASQAGGLS